MYSVLIDLERGIVMDFINEMKQKAKQSMKTIVLPETNDIRTIKAAATILEEVKKLKIKNTY